MHDDPFAVKSYQRADEIWEALSPTQDLFPKPYQLLYRGHASADWTLLPAILREPASKVLDEVLPGTNTADEQVFLEHYVIRSFMEFCDQVAIRLPNDSAEFRQSHIEKANDPYLLDPSKWPNPKLLEIMAVAQHHGVPTRLLDWTTNPYAAVYFAASDALSMRGRSTNQHLAIWVLNIELINLYSHIEIFQAPGSVSRRVAAQLGRFTIHPHSGARGEPFQVKPLEEYFSTLPSTPLLKMMVDVRESVRLLELCAKVGITSATMMRGADGAGRAVMDALHSSAAQWHGWDGPPLGEGE